ncbi:hypothetical protein ILUMI_22612 [Ignelater luminosus]|uniref:Uncharacterized protein n=1 Tax=Ignelater luminosus TaxID=2038154 RepID=A0A8K0CFG4_IGNLU|nr:hypothetical protein ILUMI_22612 [Ignelater luminosus]
MFRCCVCLFKLSYNKVTHISKLVIMGRRSGKLAKSAKVVKATGKNETKKATSTNSNNSVQKWTGAKSSSLSWIAGGVALSAALFSMIKLRKYNFNIGMNKKL